MQQAYTLTFGGLSASVTRKRIKYMHIYVKPPEGHIEVTAPFYASDAEIQRFLLAKEGWIREKAALYPIGRIEETRLVTGGRFAFKGCDYPLAVIEGSGLSLVIAGGSANLTAPMGSTEKQRQEFADKWYAERLYEAISARLPLWEERMGLTASCFTIMKMTSRWGSCNAKKAKLTFNLELIKKPEECLDYIIIHELAHLKECNHSVAFWDIVAIYCPGWKLIRKRLNMQN